MNKGSAKPKTKKTPRVVVLRDGALNVFTDGSCLPTPRRGGIGIRFVTTNASGEEVFDDHCLPGYAGASNNQMELMACIKALEIVPTYPKLAEVQEVWVYTDSMYVADHVPNALFVWPKAKWTYRNGRPVENADLWKQLAQAVKKVPRRVRFQWVKGHSKNVHNKAVDKLAKQSANGVLNKALRPTTVRRKKTAQSVHVGSIKMEGQTFAIRVVTDTYLKTQKLYKYMYEVLTESSPYCGNADYIYSTLLLRAGHHYQVRVNSESRNPRIIDVLCEIDRVTGAPIDDNALKK